MLFFPHAKLTLPTPPGGDEARPPRLAPGVLRATVLPFLGAFIVSVCLSSPADAHFLWARVEPGSAPSLSVYFSEEPADRSTGVPLSRLSAAAARDASGRSIPLVPASSRLTGALAAGEGVAAATQSWGIVDRSTDGSGAFRLEYYAKAAASTRAASEKAGIPYEAFVSLSGGKVVVSVRTASGPAANAAVRLHFPAGAAKDGLTDAAGIATFELAGPGLYGVRARVTEKVAGGPSAKGPAETRHYTTLVFPVTDVEAATAAPKGAAPASTGATRTTTADPAAYQLLKNAHDSRQVMPEGFTGFRCELVYRDGDRALTGKLTYRRKGETEIDVRGASEEDSAWLKDQLQNLVGHRRGGDFAAGDGRYPLQLGADDGNPYGRKVIVNDPLQSEYRVRDNKVLEVVRTQDGMRFTISVLQTFDTEFGKYIAHHFLVSYRDLATGRLKKVDGYRDSHSLFDDVYLPTSRTVISIEEGSQSPRVRTVSLRDIVPLEKGAAGGAPKVTTAAAVALPPSGPIQNAPGTPSGPVPTMSVTEAVTVLATGMPETVSKTAVPVTVVDEETIVRELMADVRDLVRWAPGVYAENNATRYGLNGVNIRGVGGNRVHTQIDGVRTAEQFDFGPFSVTQYALDPEALRSVEIVRSAGSALYGSDALGGVLAYATKDPADYLARSSRETYFGAKAGYDGRRNEMAESLAFAIGGEKLQASAFVARRDGGEFENQGAVETEDATRTAPNPQEREATNVLAKVVAMPAPGHKLRLTAERFDARTRTDVLTSRGMTTTGSTLTTVSDVEGTDEQDRTRVGLDWEWEPKAAFFDRLALRGSWASDESRQVTTENRLSVSPVRTTDLYREGLLTFEQRSLEGDARFSKHLASGTTTHDVTVGASAGRDTFDQLRERADTNNVTGAPLPNFPLVFPTKYFPRSEATSLAAFVQDSISIRDGLVRITPGVRFDRFRLDADQDDAVYLSGNEGIAPPVDMDESAVSPRVGIVLRISSPLSAYGQYARGFRAPPFSYVNNGFTNVASGYTTLPNGSLEPELSDNFELGARGTFRGREFSAGAFENRFSDFIEIVAVGVNPSTGLLEFQPQNVNEARIRGVEIAGTATVVPGVFVNVAFAALEGENRVTGQPINSVPPTKLVTGVRWQALPALGLEAIGTFVGRKDAVDTTAVNQVKTPGYGLLDLTISWDVSAAFSIQAALFNALDKTYLAWPDVQGISSSSAVLDRYTSPGRALSLTARVGL